MPRAKAAARTVVGKPVMALLRVTSQMRAVLSSRGDDLLPIVAERRVRYAPNTRRYEKLPIKIIKSVRGLGFQLSLGHGRSTQTHRSW